MWGKNSQQFIYQSLQCKETLMFLVCVELLSKIKLLCTLEHLNMIYVGAILCTAQDSIPISRSPQRSWWGLVLAETCALRRGQLYITSRQGDGWFVDCSCTKLYSKMGSTSFSIRTCSACIAYAWHHTQNCTSIYISACMRFAHCVHFYEAHLGQNCGCTFV